MNFNIEYKLSCLKRSKFRSKFSLKEKDKQYIQMKGLDTIEKHARDFVRNRLSKEIISNDGRQTPMRGHPVFVAQHATATCCRGCLYKWHHIPMKKELSFVEQDYIVDLIMVWIKQELDC